MWYPVHERSLRIAIVGSSASAAGAFNGAIAFGVGHLNGTAGMEGFRWLFVSFQYRSISICTSNFDMSGPVNRGYIHINMCADGHLDGSRLSGSWQVSSLYDYHECF